MSDSIKHLIAGCSFTDPAWQMEIPWSVEYARTHPSYIVAKAGMGIKGICTETVYYLEQLPAVSKLILVLPNIWRIDIEVDSETYLCNSMVDLITAHNGWSIDQAAERKWLVSGGLNYSRDTEQAPFFDFVLRHQGFLVLAKEHFRSLKILQNYCKHRKIQYYISAIQDPMQQLTGLDYIRHEIVKLLKDVEYERWFKFDNCYIDEFLGHTRHPTTDEHQLLCKHILDITG